MITDLFGELLFGVDGELLFGAGSELLFGVDGELWVGVGGELVFVGGKFVVPGMDVEGDVSVGTPTSVLKGSLCDAFTVVPGILGVAPVEGAAQTAAISSAYFACTSGHSFDMHPAICICKSSLSVQ